MAPHILVVGGTGMLAGLVDQLVAEGGRLSLLSRGAANVSRAGVKGYSVNYYDDAAFSAALDAAIGDAGAIDLAIAWFHTLSIAAPRRLAERVGAPGRPGRLVQVLGSAVADPARPDRLTTAASLAAGLADCQLRQVVLGFKVGGTVSRWLTDGEISSGVLDAVRTDRALSIVGQVEPWPARP